MRAECKAFCSNNWYLLAGVLFQKKQPKLPSSSNDHVASNRGLTDGHGRVSSEDCHVVHGDGHVSSAVGHISNGNGHISMGNGHIERTKGTQDGHANDAQDGAVGDCSGLRHRYAVGADGTANTAEDQIDDLIKVMTALS